MLLVKILKRKDASSVLVAILLAMVISQALPTTTARLAGKIAGLQNGQFYGYAAPGSGWKGEYLYPIVWALIQLVVLEVLAWVCVLGASPFKKKR